MLGRCWEVFVLKGKLCFRVFLFWGEGGGRRGGGGGGGGKDGGCLFFDMFVCFLICLFVF